MLCDAYPLNIVTQTCLGAYIYIYTLSPLPAVGLVRLDVPNDDDSTVFLFIDLSSVLDFYVLINFYSDLIIPLASFERNSVSLNNRVRVFILLPTRVAKV